MKADIFKYKLPEERIAKYPPKTRGATNLLVYNRKTEEIEHKRYFNIVEYVKSGDVVVLNETKVLNVRTYFLNDKGRELEILFLNQEDRNWFCLIGGGRYVKDGDILYSKEDSSIKAKILEKKDRGYIVEVLAEMKADEIFKKIGHTPLPPYMNRNDIESDRERYNTVFNRIPGSSAAPTASLNLTDRILKQIENKGARILKIELRVGWGTFAPIREKNIEDHKIHEEYISISQDVADEINKAKENGSDIWAFGTTVTRALESVTKNGKVQQYSGSTNLYIYPGYEFQIVDHLVTNFHQPDSTLILLVSAFAGIEEIKKLYNIALENDYKFLSYGDSMLII